MLVLKKMYNFRNDYSSGAHPNVMRALMDTNTIRTPGYGCDSFCADASEMIRNLSKAPNSDVHFLIGGTQVNKTSINAFLRSYEAVLAASTAHISVHETGAIEQNGHKVLCVETKDGKLTPESLLPLLESHSGEHMVSPKLVFISNTTEVGTVYSKDELQNLSRVCRDNGLLLYCDGARLGCAMTINGADTVYSDYATFCDAFTIGGTKNGLLFGEALVIVNDSLKPCFRSFMKQQGALLAKGRLLGVQYQAILKDDLYLKLARHSNEMAEIISGHLKKSGIPVLYDSPSNQIFPVLPNDFIHKLEEQFAFEHISPIDRNSSCIRFVTAWDTTEEEVNALLNALTQLQ